MARIVVVAVLGLLAAVPGAEARDRDRDGMADAWERKHRVFGAKADADRDGLTNAVEYRRRLHPRRRDTDKDHLRDGDELRYRWDPRKPDTDGDGVKDGLEGAGRIEAATAGTLTLRLANGKRRSARVGDDTVTVCRSADIEEEAPEPEPGPDPWDALDAAGAPSNEPEVHDEGAPEAESGDCSNAFSAGALVRSAAVRDGVFTHLELV